MKLKNGRAIEKMRVAGRLVAECFALLEQNIKPGISLYELDQLTEKLITDRGATPLYKGYEGSGDEHPPFPGTICASINNEICHGLPDQRILKDGDLVGIDIGLRYQGYCGDACVTFPVGNIAKESERMLAIGKEALRIGIESVHPGGYLNDIGRAIQAYTDTQGVTVVHEWGGHGIGRELHESPSVSHIQQEKRGLKLRPGMVFTIEPMINAGGHEWLLLDDGWTVITKDGSISVQFEHTIAITKTGIEILTML